MREEGDDDGGATASRNLNYICMAMCVSGFLSKIEFFEKINSFMSKKSHIWYCTDKKSQSLTSLPS